MASHHSAAWPSCLCREKSERNKVQAKLLSSSAGAAFALLLIMGQGAIAQVQPPKTDWVEPPHRNVTPQKGQATPGFSGFSSMGAHPHFTSTYDPHPDLFPDLPKARPAGDHKKEPPTPGIVTTPVGISEDPNVGPVEGQAANTLRNWGSLGSNGWVPPDPACAVGPRHVVVMTNDDWAIYNKRGDLQYSVDINSFTGDSGKLFDPRCVYDNHSNRWLLLYLRIDSSAKTAHWVVFVSDDEDPNGGWWWYYFDATLNGGTPTNNWVDYPDIGFDQNGVYLTGNMLAFGGGFQYSKIRVLYKSQIYNAQNAGWYDFWNMTDDGSVKSRTIRAAKSYSSPSTGLLVNARASGGDYVVLWKISDPTGTPSLSGTKLTVGAYAPSGSCDQPGTGINLENQDSVLQNAAYYVNYLWCAHTVSYNWGSGAVSAIKYYRIYTPTPSIDLDWTYGADGYDYFYPAIDVDWYDDMAMVFNRSSASEYASIRHSGRRTSDSTTQGSAQLRAGDGYYSILTDGRCRWGDYSGIALDPVNGNSWWVYAEHAESGNSWGTHVGEISFQRTADVTGPSWSGFSPSATTDRTPDVSVKAQDTETGLSPTSAWYRYSTDGGANWATWVPTACTGLDSTTIVQTVSHASVPFNQDSMTANKVQFYVEDMSYNSSYSPWYNVAIDAAPPLHSGVIPSQTNDQTPNLGALVQDVTSGMDVNSVLYWYTKDAGASWTGPLAGTCTGANGSTAIQVIQASNVPFNQDSLVKNAIWFAAFDMFGNFFDTGWLNVEIDSVAPTGWNNFTPVGIVNGGSPLCTVDVRDVALGLDVSSAQYRFSINAGGSWSGWAAAACTGANGTTAFQTLSANVPFNHHDLSGNNRVQFRVSDVVGNVGTSADYVVLIDKMVQVYGHVALGSFVGNPNGMPIVVEQYNGAVLMEALPTTLNAAGDYNVYFGNPGGTQMKIKPQHHLRVRKAGGLAAGPNLIDWDVPYNGDGIANNVVDLNDITHVLLNWGPGAGTADYNGDLSVDLFDLSISLVNFGTAGD